LSRRRKAFHYRRVGSGQLSIHLLGALIAPKAEKRRRRDASMS
jgi:hypothetical protein